MTDCVGVHIVVFTMQRDCEDLRILPALRHRARLIALRTRRAGADGVRGARVRRGEGEGDHFPLPSSSGMKMETETP
jgi:hypothetical protein